MTIYSEIKKAYPDIRDGMTVMEFFDTTKDVLAIKVSDGESPFLISRFGYDRMYEVSRSSYTVQKPDGSVEMEDCVIENINAFRILNNETGERNFFTLSSYTPLNRFFKNKDNVKVEFLKKGDCTPEELYAIYQDGGEIEAFDDTDNFQKFYGLKTRDTENEGSRFLEDDKMKVKIGHLHEELAELEKAYKNNDLVEAADALADLIYVASGTANLLNLPFSVLWRDVQNSNMNGKERVKSLTDATKRGSTFDVKKTPAWIGPRGKELIEVHNRWFRNFL